MYQPRAHASKRAKGLFPPPTNGSPGPPKAPRPPTRAHLDLPVQEVPHPPKRVANPQKHPNTGLLSPPKAPHPCPRRPSCAGGPVFPRRPAPGCPRLSTRQTGGAGFWWGGLVGVGWWWMDGLWVGGGSSSAWPGQAWPQMPPPHPTPLPLRRPKSNPLNQPPPPNAPSTPLQPPQPRQKPPQPPSNPPKSPSAPPQTCSVSGVRLWVAKS